MDVHVQIATYALSYKLQTLALPSNLQTTTFINSIHQNAIISIEKVRVCRLYSIDCFKIERGKMVFKSLLGMKDDPIRGTIITISVISPFSM